MKKLFTTFAIALTLTLVGCGSTESQATKTEYKEETTTTTTTTAKIEEPKEEETTATTTAPAESEPETTTTVQEEKPYYEVNSSIFSKLTDCEEISPDDLDPERRQIFEDYILKNNIKGKYFNYQPLAYVPKYFLIPDEELITYPIFSEKQVYIICPISQAIKDGYVNENQKEYLDSMKNTGYGFVVIREWTESEKSTVDTNEEPYHWEIANQTSWYGYVGDVFVPAE